jgi:predicted permease
LTTEGALLSLAGCLVGLALADATLRTLPRWVSFDLPRLAEITLGWQAFTFAFGAAVGMTLLFAWLPAILGTRAGLAQDLRGGRQSSVSHLGWLRQTTIVGQVALALPLLVVATLLVSGLSNLRTADLGLRADGLVGTPVSLSFRRYPEPGRRQQFFQGVLDQARALPGVVSAAATMQAPLVATQADRSRFTVVGGGTSEEHPRALLQVVTAGYFATIGSRIVEGRDFRSSDHATSQPVVIITEALRRRHFPDRSPLGQRLDVELVIDKEPRVRTIVGVAGDIAQFGPAAPVEPMVFLPHAQVSWPAMTVLMRTHGPAPPLLQALRAAVLRADPTAILEPSVVPARALDGLLSPYRSAATVISGFAIFAAALCFLGLYGLLSYDVEQSRRDSAIRMAIGASRQSTRFRFLWRALQLVSAGTLAGVAAAWAAIRLLRSAVTGLGDLDPLSLTLVPVVLMAVAFIAIWVPVSRATNVPLASTLRSD